MKIDNILTSKQINPAKVIFKITAKDALASLKEASEEFSLNIDFDRLSKEELEKLLSDYADAILIYHPEDYHQERVAFLKNQTTFKRYGLTNENIDLIDFV